MFGLLFLSGCISYKINQTFNEDGTSEVSIEMNFSEYIDYVKSMSLDLVAKAEKNISDSCKSLKHNCYYDKKNKLLHLNYKTNEGYEFKK